MGIFLYRPSKFDLWENAHRLIKPSVYWRVEQNVKSTFNEGIQAQETRGIIMYYKTWEEWQKACPIVDGIWDKERLYGYLVAMCHEFRKPIETFFREYQDDENLVDLLFSFLFDDDYDGSDSQMGAAYVLQKMDRQLLRKKKDLLLKAQANEVNWKRPFPHDEHLDWLID